MTPWPAQIKADLHTLGLQHEWQRRTAFRSDEIDEWRRIVKQEVTRRENSRWWREVNKSILLQLHYAVLKSSRPIPRLVLEPYLTVPHGGWNDRVRLGRCALTRLRSGTSELRIHTGRFVGPQRAERICRLCADDVETESHFLLDCSFYSTDRQQLWSSIDAIV